MKMIGLKKNSFQQVIMKELITIEKVKIMDSLINPAKNIKLRTHAYLRILYNQCLGKYV